MMKVIRQKIYDWMISSVYSRSVIGEIDGLEIVSVRDRPEEFLNVITSSLELIRDHDPYRYNRLLSSSERVVECSLAYGAQAGEYQKRFSAIAIDFDFSDEIGDELEHAALYAGILVHEATHGYLLNRGFEYNEETRIQTERICVAEENRFLRRLNVVRRGLGDALVRDFEPELWEEAWAMTRWERVKNSIRRVIETD